MAASSISLHFNLFPSSAKICSLDHDECCWISPKDQPLQKKKKRAAAYQVVRAAGFAASASGMIAVEEKKEMTAGDQQGLVFKVWLYGASLMAKIVGTAQVYRKLLYSHATSLLWTSNPAVFLEKAIMDCRFFTLMGIFGSLAGSILCFFEGCFLVIQSYFGYFNAISTRLDQGGVLQLILEAIDMFLVGTAMLMFGMGLYSMFIGNRGTPSRRINGYSINGSNLFGLFHLQRLPAWMEMNSVAQAKSGIGHAVVMLLQSGMVDKVKSVPLVSGMDLACFAAAIFTASATIFLLARIHSNRTRLRDKDSLRSKTKYKCTEAMHNIDVGLGGII